MTHTHTHTHSHTHMHLTFTTVWQYTAGIHEYDYIVTTHHSKPVLSQGDSTAYTAYIWPIRVSDTLPTFGQSVSDILQSHALY